jgi:serine/threonine protein kinase
MARPVRARARAAAARRRRLTASNDAHARTHARAGGRFIVTEFLARGSLRAVLDDGSIAIDWALRLRFGGDVARGMAYLHSEGPRKRPMIHRDLKTHNLLVSERWIVKVGDFGTSRIRAAAEESQAHAQQQQQQQRTHAPLVAHGTLGVGSLVYRAPELLRGERDYTAAIDVYSFGVILWELATRGAPFAELADQFAITAAVLAGQRPPVADGGPREYRALMVRCWDERADRRPSFADVEEAIAGIEAAQATGSSVA